MFHFQKIKKAVSRAFERLVGEHLPTPNLHPSRASNLQSYSLPSVSPQERALSLVASSGGRLIPQGSSPTSPAAVCYRMSEVSSPSRTFLVEFDSMEAGVEFERLVKAQFKGIYALQRTNHSLSPNDDHFKHALLKALGESKGTIVDDPTVTLSDQETLVTFHSPGKEFSAIVKFPDLEKALRMHSLICQATTSLSQQGFAHFRQANVPSTRSISTAN